MWTRVAAVERLPFGGLLLRTPSARVRDLNQIVLDEPAPDLTAEVLAAAMRRLGVEQADIGHVETARRLLPGMEADGHQVQDFVLLVAPAELPPAPVAAEECDRETILPLRHQWLLEEGPFASDAELREQVLRADRLLWEANDARGFCVRDGGGNPLARAQLMAPRDGMAMIEDVYTAPAHRGKGYGAAVVLAAAAAARAAGCDVVYLPTVAEGLAQLFYRGLGFEPASVITRFVTPANATSGP